MLSAKSCSSSSGTTSSEQNRIRRVGRGASLPAKPRSSVAGHHVFGTKWGFGRLGVVLRSPQCLVLSSPGTTSLEQNRIRQVGRGASLPAMPCSFVAGHHVFGAKSDFGRLNVVLHSPQCLVLSSPGTTSACAPE